MYNEKVKELAAFYNTWGIDNDFSKEAEKRLVENNKKLIQEARELAAMARNVI